MTTPRLVLFVSLLLLPATGCTVGEGADEGGLELDVYGGRVKQCDCEIKTRRDGGELIHQWRDRKADDCSSQCSEQLDGQIGEAQAILESQGHDGCYDMVLRSAKIKKNGSENSWSIKYRNIVVGEPETSAPAPYCPYGFRLDGWDGTEGTCSRRFYGSVIVEWQGSTLHVYRHNESSDTESTLQRISPVYHYTGPASSFVVDLDSSYGYTDLTVRVDRLGRRTLSCSTL